MDVQTIFTVIKEHLEELGYTPEYPPHYMDMLTITTETGLLWLYWGAPNDEFDSDDPSSFNICYDWILHGSEDDFQRGMLDINDLGLIDQIEELARRIS